MQLTNKQEEGLKLAVARFQAGEKYPRTYLTNSIKPTFVL